VNITKGKGEACLQLGFNLESGIGGTINPRDHKPGGKLTMSLLTAEIEGGKKSWRRQAAVGTRKMNIIGRWEKKVERVKRILGRSREECGKVRLGARASGEGRFRVSLKNESVNQYN